jgi:GTP 3',8-cyclase
VAGQPDLLTDDEIVRLIRTAVTDLGIEEVRFTGGEPLLRPGLVGIVGRCAALEPRPKMSLTTTVKVNAVLMLGLNGDEAPDLLAWAVRNAYELRFIGQMPLDVQHGWKRDGMITAGDILESLRTRFTLTVEGEEERGSAPAERWVVDGGPHRVGVIASVTRPFCQACDRTRLTADGQVRNCLFAREETDLRAALRSEAPDEEIARIWKLAMWGKKAGSGLDDPAFLQPDRPMSAIGG